MTSPEDEIKAMLRRPRWYLFPVCLVTGHQFPAVVLSPVSARFGHVACRRCGRTKLVNRMWRP
jgi:hypothetical protein